MKDQPIILFDGVCNLCNGAVNFVIKKDKKSRLKLGAIQSEQGQDLLKNYGLSTSEMNTFIFIENEKAYTRSIAALKVSKYLGGLWPMFYGFIIVPKFIRDGIYNWIAKNRYNWFGRKDQCMMPTPEVRQRFL
ncbi:MAG: thiol-disulfide oxidoreductase DCC family protein [Ferruginibacter sp.]